MRITVDTNQLIRALMRPPQLATFIMAWQADRFTVVCSHQLLTEYLLVIDYPEIAELIYPELRRVFFAQLLPEIELFHLPEIPAVCRDPEDDKVLATALWGNVDYLVTADSDLTTPAIAGLLRREGIELATMDEIIAGLDQPTSSSTS
jgi:putative PIN family toxin of toxin-antitoxin system